MRALAIAAVVLACSSERSETSETSESTSPAPPKVIAPEVAPSTAPDDCRAGDIEACKTAGMFELGCAHGDAESCVAEALRDRDNRERWLARACRRGSEGSCSKRRETVAVELADRPEGSIADRVESIYQHTVVDCYHETSSEAPVEVKLAAGAEGSLTAVAESRDEKLQSCVAALASQWAFPNDTVSGTLAFKFRIKPPDVPDASDDDDALREMVANTALLKVLGSDDGPMPTDMGVGLDEAIADIKEGESGGSVRGGVSTRGGHISRKTSRASIATGPSTPDAVGRKIRIAYLRGVKRCHAKTATDGTAMLRLEVGPTGRVESARVTGFAEIASCVEALAKKWRFDTPKDDGGEPTRATYKLSIRLKAN